MGRGLNAYVFGSDRREKDTDFNDLRDLLKIAACLSFEIPPPPVAKPASYPIPSITNPRPLAECRSTVTSEILTAFNNPGTYLHIGAPGLGKTQALVNLPLPPMNYDFKYNQNQIERHSQIVIAVPTLAKADELANELKKASDAKNQFLPKPLVVRGRSAINPDTNLPMCQRWELVEELQEKNLNLSIAKSLCKIKFEGEEIKCPHYHGCAYARQQAEMYRNPVHITSHANVFSYKSPMWRNARSLIIDESPMSTSVVSFSIDTDTIRKSHPAFELLVSELEKNNSLVGNMELVELLQSFDGIDKTELDLELDRQINDLSLSLSIASYDMAAERKRAMKDCKKNSIDVDGINNLREHYKEARKKMKESFRKQVAEVESKRIRFEIQPSYSDSEIKSILDNIPKNPIPLSWLSVAKVAIGMCNGNRLNGVRVANGKLTCEYARKPVISARSVIGLDGTGNQEIWSAILGKPVTVIGTATNIDDYNVDIVQDTSISFYRKHWRMDKVNNVPDPAVIGKVLAGNYDAVIGQKDFITAMAPHLSCIKTTHFNANRGLNTLENCENLLVVGMIQPRCADVEGIARALFPNEEISTQANYSRAVGVNNSRLFYHTDPRCQTVLSQIRDAELIQSISRIRPFSTNKKAKVTVWSTIPIEHIFPVRYVTDPTPTTVYRILGKTGQGSVLPLSKHALASYGLTSIENEQVRWYYQDLPSDNSSTFPKLVEYRIVGSHGGPSKNCVVFRDTELAKLALAKIHDGSAIEFPHEKECSFTGGVALVEDIPFFKRTPPVNETYNLYGFYVIQDSNGYYRLKGKVGNKTKLIYIGKVFNPDVALAKLKSAGVVIDTENQTKLPSQEAAAPLAEVISLVDVGRSEVTPAVIPAAEQDPVVAESSKDIFKIYRGLRNCYACSNFTLSKLDTRYGRCALMSANCSVTHSCSLFNTTLSNEYNHPIINRHTNNNPDIVPKLVNTV